MEGGVSAAALTMLNPNPALGWQGGCRSVLPLRPRTHTAPAILSPTASSSTRNSEGGIGKTAQGKRVREEGFLG